MGMEDVFVGLDCGGSSTRLLAVSRDGRVVATGQAGGANLLATPEKKLLRNLTAAAQDCPPARFVCAGFAGLVSEEDRRRALGYLSMAFPGATLRAEPDYYAAFAASEPGTDVCVIAGTGSLVCSRIGGAIVKSGGRGYLLGDEGSAFQYGRDALLAFLDDPSQVGPETRDLLEKGFRTLEPSDLVSQVYRASSPQAPIARLAKGFAADLRDGKPYALASLRRHSHLLAGVITRHLERNALLNLGRPIQVSLAGGMWQSAPAFRLALEAGLLEANPGEKFAMARITRAPVQGAADLAREMG